MSGHEIRKVELHDMDALISLMSQHADYEEAEFSIKGKKEKLTELMFSQTPQLYCYVVVMSAEVKGYFSFTYDVSTWDALPYLHLDCLFLDEDIRGNGIGAEVLKFLKEEAKQNGCVNLQWQTPVFNHSAIRFYKKNGALSKTKERFFLKLEDDQLWSS